MLKEVPMKLRRAFVFSLLACLAFATAARAITVEELRAMPHLTPVEFAHYFADFEFKFHPEVQPHNQFLSTRSGDCDDYATVAADALEKHGYTPRMIAIRMKGETHVVCYIPETHSYLDYNTRKDKNPLVPCSPEITDIARNVAKGFGRDWVATYEFTYEEEESIKRLVNRIIPNPAISNEAKVLTTEQARSGASKPAK
jgi:hypothetical protein